uniref:Uncharacterized protein n=1 Tax=Rhizophora mucronata TaxID=61149 RepID=A0A2P2PZS1_RHIMU
MLACMFSLEIDFVVSVTKWCSVFYDVILLVKPLCRIKYKSKKHVQN